MRNKHLYSEDWYLVIRPAVLKRDNFKCVECGVSHKQFIIFENGQKTKTFNKVEAEEARNLGFRVVQQFLQVSHKNHDRNDNSLENLQSLCVSCHFKFDREMNIIKRKSKNKF